LSWTQPLIAARLIESRRSFLVATSARNLRSRTPSPRYLQCLRSLLCACAELRPKDGPHGTLRTESPDMGETPRPLLELIARQALKSHVEAAEHIRDCARCERLFITAYEVKLEQNEHELGLFVAGDLNTNLKPPNAGRSRRYGDI